METKGFTYSFDCKPDFGFVTINIPTGKKLKVEAGAMATMDTNIEMKTKIIILKELNMFNKNKINSSIASLTISFNQELFVRFLFFRILRSTFGFNRKIVTHVSSIFFFLYKMALVGGIRNLFW